jgi:hypothetical protein
MSLSANLLTLLFDGVTASNFSSKDDTVSRPRGEEELAADLASTDADSDVDIFGK